MRTRLRHHPQDVTPPCLYNLMPPPPPQTFVLQDDLQNFNQTTTADHQITPKDGVIIGFILILWLYSIMLMFRAWNKILNFSDDQVRRPETATLLWRWVLEHIVLNRKKKIREDETTSHQSQNTVDNDHGDMPKVIIHQGTVCDTHVTSPTRNVTPSQLMVTTTAVISDGATTSTAALQPVLLHSPAESQELYVIFHPHKSPSQSRPPSNIASPTTQQLLGDSSQRTSELSSTQPDV